ncbi:MAG: glycoside hydrolase family 3 C-terminal domain-containing protein [Oscillospiraceae bacterium]|nr:glycoside hydrolase family 3 C-terminal domain-containing protein [Oscillospiraceae bacterium]
MAKIFAPTSPDMTERERRNMQKARRIAAEGMVLLENRGVLPLKADGRALAVFGNGVRRMVKGGTGSGDVNSRTVVNVEQGLEDAGFSVASKAWLDRFDEACTDYMQQYMADFKAVLQEKGFAGVNWALENPYRDPDVPEITEEDMAGDDRSCALYVIARTSGEGADRKLSPGDYELSEREKDNLRTLTAHYKHTVVILNVGGVIDTKFLRAQKGIDAILLMSQPGCAGGLALADVLTGKVTPGGRLTATWAEDYSDYPCAESLGYLSGDLDDSYYREGVYVGYRWFDSFNLRPAYPFGFGLSYTSFEIGVKRVEIRGEAVRVTAAVKNSGEHAGRETVQVYVSQPQGKLDKPCQVLAGFAKTAVLSPGQEETVTVEFPIRSLASYDEEKAAWVLERGTYYIRVGSHSRNTHIAAALSLDESVVTEQLQNKVKPDCELNILHAEPEQFYTYPSEAAEKAEAMRLEIIPATIPTRTADYSAKALELRTDKTDPISLADVLSGRAALDELTAQLSISELAALTVGASRGGFGGISTVGAASNSVPGAAGDTTSELSLSRGIENLVLADGPAGLRLSKTFVTDGQGNVVPGLGESAFGNLFELLGVPAAQRPEGAVDHYQYCTAIPIATMLAQTWDPALIEEAGDLVGEEMEELGVDLWLAPGMNIHRNPLCGRNFEYYSEDPLLSGVCAAADTRGVQKHPGRGTTIKHFALNNQEDNRSHSNSHCSERALREIYLKGFEIAVKTAQPLSLMTSYNLVNGVHAANHRELITDILRCEWGFQGLVMTDWGTTDASQGFQYGSSDAALCIKAGNDLTMPGSQEDVDAIVNAVGGKLTLAELQACAKRVLELVILRETGKSRP